MENDFYCDVILKGKVKINKVLETENFLAYHHTKPAWAVHIIVIPKFHVLNLSELILNHKDMIPEMMDILQKVVIKTEQDYGGCRLTTNTGNVQNSKHLHWHIYVGDMNMDL
ncbi:MAG: HIT domain-containing protein [Spirochaetales bacterium]|nr:HIT domain-containing protein [Spirochaetales bacterium]